MPERKLAPLELLWLAAAMLVAATLRLHGLAAVAVEHHDEGVYAANLNCGADDGGEYPSRPFYGPPLWPLAIEWTMVAGRVLGHAPDWLPILPGVLAGIALTPSAWWVARRWFGPAAAIAVAWLVATSDFHAFYSRTALTDAPLVLCWLWAVYWTWRALDTSSSLAAILAGACTALAWWTKYNGWIPLAIAASGGLAAMLLMRADARPWRSWLKTLAIVFATTFALWSPVLWDCQKVGGYSAVAANHRGYIAPWSAWFEDLARQGENFAAYCGASTLWGILAAIVGAWFFARRASTTDAPSCPPRLRAIGSRRSDLIVAACSLATLAACIWLAGWALGLWLGATIVAIGLALLRFARNGLQSEKLLAASLLSAWFFGMLLATPVYRPYPRLLMPLWLAGTLGIAWLLAELLETSDSRANDPPSVSDLKSLASSPEHGRLRSGRPGLAIAALACAAIGCALACLAPGRLAEDRTCFAGAADDIAELLRRESAAHVTPVVVVYGEPALFDALTERGVAATVRDNLDFSNQPPQTPTYLATGIFVDQDPSFQQAWRAAEARFQAVDTWTLRPSSLVLFDYERPADWTNETSVRPLRLYRLREK